jgi:hypothetical protein
MTYGKSSEGGFFVKEDGRYGNSGPACSRFLNAENRKVIVKSKT